MKRIATFAPAPERLLCGRAAIAAWRSQSVRCPCGYCSDPRRAVSGSAGDMPAKWLGCDNPGHHGQALGQPLVYRLPSQMG